MYHVTSRQWVDITLPLVGTDTRVLVANGNNSLIWVVRNNAAFQIRFYCPDAVTNIEWITLGR